MPPQSTPNRLASVANIVAPTVRDDASNGPGTKVKVSLPGERSTPTDAINRPTSVHGSAGPSNSASHWGYSTRDAPLRDPYRLAVNDCISGAADRHRPGKSDEHHTSGRNR